jgi:predicted DNA-binding transcriptional regulator AlpA
MDNSETNRPECVGVLFWRIRIVRERVGLSKTEIYRRMADTDPALNPFPQSRRYRGSQRVYWRSDEVCRWQEIESAGPPPLNVAELIG